MRQISSSQPTSRPVLGASYMVGTGIAFAAVNTLTPILKKLEELGYLQRKRDPADERQVIVHLTEEGRRLREKGLCMNLVKETGLSPEDFRHLQKGIVALRNNLAKAAKNQRA